MLLWTTGQTPFQEKSLLTGSLTTPKTYPYSWCVSSWVEGGILKQDGHSYRGATKIQKMGLVEEWSEKTYDWPLSFYKKALREKIYYQKQRDSLRKADAENLLLLEKRAHSVTEALVTAVSKNPKVKFNFLEQVQHLKKNADAFQIYWLRTMTERLIFLPKDQGASQAEDEYWMNQNLPGIQDYRRGSELKILSKIDVNRSDDHPEVTIAALKQLLLMIYWDRKLDKNCIQVINSVHQGELRPLPIRKSHSEKVANLAKAYEHRPGAVRQRALCMLTERQEFLKSISECLCLGDDKEVELKILDNTPLSRLSSYQKNRLFELNSQERYCKMILKELNKTTTGLRNIYLNGDLSPAEEEILENLNGNPWGLEAMIGELDSTPLNVPDIISRARGTHRKYMIEKMRMDIEGPLSESERGGISSEEKFLGKAISGHNSEVLEEELVGDLLMRVQHQASIFKCMELNDQQKKYEKRFENAFEIEFQNEVDYESRKIFEKLRRRKVILTEKEFIIWEKFLTQADQYMSPSVASGKDEAMAEWFLKLSLECPIFQLDGDGHDLYTCLHQRQELSRMQKLQLHDAASAFEELLWNNMADVDKILYALKYTLEPKTEAEKNFQGKIMVHGLTISERFFMMATLRQHLFPSTREWVSMLYGSKGHEKIFGLSPYLMVNKYLDQNSVIQMEIDKDINTFENILEKKLERRLKDIEKLVEIEIGIKNRFEVGTLLKLVFPYSVSASRPQRLLIASKIGREDMFQLARLYTHLAQAPMTKIDHISIWKEVSRIVIDSEMIVQNAVHSKAVQYTMDDAAIAKWENATLAQEEFFSAGVLDHQTKFFLGLLNSVGLKNGGDILLLHRVPGNDQD